MDIVKLFQAIKNFASNTIFKITGKVDVDLSPVVKAIKEIPEQEIADSINISNLKEVNDEIAKLGKGVVDTIKGLDTDVDLSEVVNAIKSIPKVELPEQIDFSQNIVKELQSLSKALTQKKEKGGKIDKSLMNKLMDIEETIENEFAAVSFNGRLNVRLPEDQVKEMGKSIVTSGGGSTIAKQNEMITAIEAVSGLQRSTDMDGGGKVAVGTTAVEATFIGVTEKVIITADIANSALLYIGKSNVTSDGSNALTFLSGGDEIILDYDDTTNGIYVVGASASQNFWKGALI